MLFPLPGMPFPFPFFTTLAKSALPPAVMAWVPWAWCHSFSSMFSLLPLYPPSGPVVNLGYWFVSLPVAWSELAR